MAAIFNIILPVFLLIALGYAAMRFSLFTREQIDGIGRFIMVVGMPSLVFNALATRPLAEVVNPVYLAGYGIGSAVSFAVMQRLCLRCGQPPVLSVLNGLAAGMANSGFIGYPVLMMAIGSAAGGFFAMNVLVESIVILPVMFVLIEIYRGGGGNWAVLLRRIGLGLLKNPIVPALLASLLVALTGMPLPAVLAKTVATLASATAPLALFVIGASLFGLTVRGNMKDLLLGSMGKMVLMLVSVVFFLWLFGADRDTLYAGALLACAPTPSIYALFGRQYGYGEQTAGVMLLTTVVSAVPFFAVLWLWR
ncbi:AEC family transporter [Neisseria sp.]|uniref:AEC family transporter n=1 Tax=Neisseria sp. TaxID=192066 RepID=UPI0035A04C83